MFSTSSFPYQVFHPLSLKTYTLSRTRTHTVPGVDARGRQCRVVPQLLQCQLDGLLQPGRVGDRRRDQADGGRSAGAPEPDSRVRLGSQRLKGMAIS